MRKISVITLHSVFNYGTQLQAYATQEILQQYLEGKVEFVNYRRPDTYGRGLINLYTQRSLVRWLAFLPTFFRWQLIFKKFQKKHLKISSKIFLSSNDFKKNSVEADVYFSGSDQIWNTGWNKGVIPPFYLSYAPNNKPKYAFSSSFGQDEVPEKYVNEIKTYLLRYKKISVRELTGINILKKQFNIQNAIQIIDPTLSFNGNYWRQFKNKKKIPSKYILIYNLNNNRDFDNYAKELSERCGYKLYRFCTRYDQIRKCGKSLLIPKVEDFVTYIDNAAIVLTDSFHASAFATNLNTKVIILPPKEYSSRLHDFAHLVGIEKCIAKNYQDYSPIEYTPNFSKINTILENERTRTYEFLKAIKKELDNEN